MQIASRKHDLMAIQVYDQLSTALQPVGLMKVWDPETGGEQWIDSSSKRVQVQYATGGKGYGEDDNLPPRQAGWTGVSVSTESDYVKSLLQLLQQRR